MAKARVEVAHEVRLAKEAEAEMDLHVQKAAQKIANEEKKYIHEPEGDPHANTHLNNAGTGPTNKLL